MKAGAEILHMHTSECRQCSNEWCMCTHKHKCNGMWSEDCGGDLRLGNISELTKQQQRSERRTEIASMWSLNPPVKYLMVMGKRVQPKPWGSLLLFLPPLFYHHPSCLPSSSSLSLSILPFARYCFPSAFQSLLNSWSWTQKISRLNLVMH